MSKKLSVSFMGLRNSNRYYSNWEISDLSNQINSIYYKNQILTYMDDMLNAGTSLKNMICFENSVKTSNLYKGYQSGTLSFTDPEDIQKMYHLGNLVSFEPNSNLNVLSDVFEIIRFTFSYFNSNNNDFLHLNKRDAIISLFKIVDNKNMTKEELVREVRKELEELQDTSNSLLLNQESDDLSVDEQSELIRKRKDYEHCKRQCFESKKFNNLTNKLAEDYTHLDFSETEIEKQREKFLMVFNKNVRPIVAIVSEDDSSLELLGTKMFVQRTFSKDNTEFLETNNIGQNSPLVIVLTMSPVFLGHIIRAAQSRIKLAREKKAFYENKKVAASTTDAWDAKINQENEKIQELENEIHDLKIMYADDYEGNVDELNITNDNLTSLSENVITKSIDLSKKIRLSDIDVVDRSNNLTSTASGN